MSEQRKPLVFLSLSQHHAKEALEEIKRQADAGLSALGYGVVVVPYGVSASVGCDIEGLTLAIEQQGMAIQALAESNQQLIRLMAEDEVEQDERDSGGYLSGKADR